jgi:NAD(P)H-nitrite reductase large subunit
MTKLDVRKGILVNSNLQTSDGYIYAVGECAEPANGGVAVPVQLQAETVAAHIFTTSGPIFAGREFVAAI